MQKSSSLSANAQTYSDYKSQNIFKVLVGVTSTGYISFVLDAFPGAIRDPAMTWKSGLLDLLESGDSIMAHKDFPLKENCTRKMKQTKIVVIFPLIPTVKFPRLYSVGKLVKIKPEKEA